MRVSSFIIAFGIVVLITLSFYTLEISTALLAFPSLSWMQCYLLPRLVAGVIVAGIAFLLVKTISGSTLKKTLVSLIVAGVLVSLYLFQNKPYTADWNSAGKDISTDTVTVPIENYLAEVNPDFEGVVCLALAGCEYCHKAMNKLVWIKNRHPDVDVTVFVFALKQEEIDELQHLVSSVDIPVSKAPNPDVSYLITYGNFPTFLYVNQGKVIYRWFGNQFGNPAKDLVENKMSGL